MMSRFWRQLGGVLGVGLLLSGCGSDASPVEQGSPLDSGVVDTAAPQGDAAKADGDGAAPVDAAGDAARDANDGSPEDAGQERPVDQFCRSWDDCSGLEVCDFALGRCEPRATVPTDPLTIYNVKPPAAAPGDRLIIDGQAFYSGPLGFFSVTVAIGSASFSGFDLRVDENRVVIPVLDGMVGPVQLSNATGSTLSSGALEATPLGMLPCDGSTASAAVVPGSRVSETGPYAAAYVDHPSVEARITYPAKCGSVRRPPEPGTYPLVFLLHGDGALYLNYEYLAQHLATWGFVSVMPETDSGTELQALVNQLRGADLGAIVFPWLSGLEATDAVAFVGHSRGTARMQATIQDPAIAAATVASVFLGPVDDGIVVPGLFMLFGATGDGQSGPSYWDAPWGRQPGPKWKIVVQGGNHSLFSDHKVWLGFLLDSPPTITRTDQFRVVTSFVLPLLERAFGKAERFGHWLDAPPTSPLYTAESAP